MGSAVGGPEKIVPSRMGTPPTGSTFSGRFWSMISGSDKQQVAKIRDVVNAVREANKKTKPLQSQLGEHEMRVLNVVEQAISCGLEGESPFPRMTVTIRGKEFDVEQRGDRVRILGFTPSNDVKNDQALVNKILNAARKDKKFSFGPVVDFTPDVSDKDKLALAHAREVISRIQETSSAPEKITEKLADFFLEAEREAQQPALEVVCTLSKKAPPRPIITQKNQAVFERLVLSTPSPLPKTLAPPPPPTVERPSPPGYWAPKPPQKHQRTDDVVPRAVIPQVGMFRGISNYGSSCYFGAPLAALCASPAFRRSLASDNPVAPLLRSVLDDMRDQGQPGKPLSVAEKNSPIRVLHDALRGNNDPSFALLGERRQQDTRELLDPLIRVATGETLSMTSSVVVDPVIARHRFFEGVDVSSLYTPPEAFGPTALAVIPPGVSSVQEYFDGARLKIPVSINEVLTRKGISEEERKKFPGNAEGNRYVPIEMTVSHQLEGQVPPFLPVYISRFGDKGAKSTTPVVAPFHLTVPVKGGRPAEYELKSVVVHSGFSSNEGHYFTYIPDPSSPKDEGGYPTVWVKANDDAPKTTVSWSAIKDEVLRNGVVFMYDAVPSADEDSYF